MWQWRLIRWQLRNGQGRPLRAVMQSSRAAERFAQKCCAVQWEDQAGQHICCAGGDSLLAIDLMACCGEAGFTVTINDMLQATSIRKLRQPVKLTEGSVTPECSSSLAPLDGPVGTAGLLTMPSLLRRRNSNLRRRLGMTNCSN